MPTISIIAAVAENRAIGKENNLLCHLPADLKRFKNLTTGHTVIMGRRTFESLPNGALPNRDNIVITTTGKEQAGIQICRSIPEALACIKEEETEIFIIGGATVYQTFLPLADKLYLTHIHHTFADADTFFPEIRSEEWKIAQTEEHLPDEQHPYAYTFTDYIRKQNKHLHI